jgi:hypothetical protein
MEKKVGFSINDGAEVRSFEGLDFVICVGLNDLGEKTECKCSLEGTANAQDIANCIESIYDALGEEMADRVMLAQAMRHLAESMRGKDEDEEDSDGK